MIAERFHLERESSTLISVDIPQCLCFNCHGENSLYYHNLQSLCLLEQAEILLSNSRFAAGIRCPRADA